MDSFLFKLMFKLSPLVGEVLARASPVKHILFELIVTSSLPLALVLLVKSYDYLTKKTVAIVIATGFFPPLNSAKAINT